MALLRREMAGLRQADIQLMGQLRNLEHSIQDLKSVLMNSPSSSVDPSYWELTGSDSGGNNGNQDSGYSSYFQHQSNSSSTPSPYSDHI